MKGGIMRSLVESSYIRQLSPLISSLRCGPARRYSGFIDGRRSKNNNQNTERPQKPQDRLQLSYQDEHEHRYKPENYNKNGERHSTNRSNYRSNYPQNRNNYTKPKFQAPRQTKVIPPNVPVVYVSQGRSQSIKVPIQINPQNVKSFEDLKLNDKILKGLYESNQDIKSPTEIQKKMLALLKSDVSIMVRSDSGSGKSLATILYMMSYERAEFGAKDTPYITNLILVPSPQLAAQYYKQFENIVENMPGVNIHNVVQRIFRSNEEDGNGGSLSNAAQLDLLTKYPGPHTLIATPNRLLDYLSSSNRSKVPLFNLSCVALDEMDALYWKELAKADNVIDEIIKKKRKPKQIPVDLLMNHIRSWRDGYLRNSIASISRKRKPSSDISFTPLRVIMNSSVDFPGLDRMAETKPWLKENKRPVLTVGVNSSSRGITYNMPKGVNSYFVSYDPSKKELTDLPVGVTDETATISIGESNADINPIDVTTTINNYADCLLRLLTQNNNSHSPSMVIVPDGIPAHILAERIQSENVNCGLADSSSPTGFSSAVENFPLDPSTVFKSTTTTAILSQASNIHGISFHGLSNVYVLDWHLIYPKILYTKLACLTTPPSNLYLVCTKPSQSGPVQIFSSSISSIEGLSINRIKHN